jgi:3-dehydroquinate dehydratase-1
MRTYQIPHPHMKIVASVIDPVYVPVAQEEGADVIELRLDLFPSGFSPETAAILDENDLPLILTVRSREEGGKYSGSPEDLRVLIGPFLPYTTYVDLEQQFAPLAPEIQGSGKTVIASFHYPGMLSSASLASVLSRLRQYGIPKIVVRPQTIEDVLGFCSFTYHAEKPVITSIMGEKFRFTRIMLPIFGSSMIFCYAGLPAADGQFRVREARQILSPLMT